MIENFGYKDSGFALILKVEIQEVEAIKKIPSLFRRMESLLSLRFLFYLCGKNLFDLREVFIKQRNRPNAVKELFQWKIFVGRMDGIRFEAEAHQDGFDSQHLLEGGNDRDASATANRNRSFAIHIHVSFFGSLIGRNVDGAPITISAM